MVSELRIHASRNAHGQGHRIDKVGCDCVCNGSLKLTVLRKDDGLKDAGLVIPWRPIYEIFLDVYFSKARRRRLIREE